MLTDDQVSEMVMRARRFAGAYTGTAGTLAADVLLLARDRKRVVRRRNSRHNWTFRDPTRKAGQRKWKHGRNARSNSPCGMSTSLCIANRPASARSRHVPQRAIGDRIATLWTVVSNALSYLTGRNCRRRLSEAEQ